MYLSAALLTVVAVLATIVAYLVRRHFYYWQQRGVAHDKPSLLHGNFQGVKEKYHMQDIYQRYYEKYKGTGPFAGFYFFQTPGAFVLDLELAKNVLIRDFNHFTDRPAYYNEKDDPLSAHLFALDGPKWKLLRHKLSPTFTSGKMKFMFPTILKVGEQFTAVFDELLLKSSTVEIKELFARFTTDVIGTCAFGIDCHSLSDPNAEFRVMGRRSFSERSHNNLVLSLALKFPKLANRLGITVFPKDVTQFFLKAVRDTVDFRERNHVKRNDFMDILIELKHQAEHHLTLEELAAQAFVFFLAGFETSSTTSSFVLYELALNQDVQDKLRLTINTALAKHNNEFTYESVKDMKYLDQVLSETMRLYTIVPAMLRRCIKDYVVPGHPNYTIEKGSPVIIPAAAIHRDPAIYPNPNVFNPDNFAPDQIQQRDSIAWLPFGDGPRNCIGMRFGQMQARIGLALLLQRYRFTIAPETKVPVKIDVKNSLVSSEGGIFLKVERI